MNWVICYKKNPKTFSFYSPHLNRAEVIESLIIQRWHKFNVLTFKYFKTIYLDLPLYVGRKYEGKVGQVNTFQMQVHTLYLKPLGTWLIRLGIWNLGEFRKVFCTYILDNNPRRIFNQLINVLAVNKTFILTGIYKNYDSLKTSFVITWVLNKL